MKFIKHIIIKMDQQEIHLHRMLKNKKSSLVKKLRKIHELLNKKDKNLIQDMNKMDISIQINYPNGDWKIVNANQPMLNRIFG